MKNHNHYRVLREKCAQIFDSMYYEPENHSKCHKRNWERMGCFVFGVSYETYLKYLKTDTSGIPDIPSQAVDMMQSLINELLAREKYPVNLNPRQQKEMENNAPVDEIIRSISRENTVPQA